MTLVVQIMIEDFTDRNLGLIILMDSTERAGT